MHARTFTNLYNSFHVPLAKLDGGRILLAIAGTVFDVTAGRGSTTQVSKPHFLNGKQD